LNRKGQIQEGKPDPLGLFPGEKRVLTSGFSRDGIGFTGPAGTLALLGLDTPGPAVARRAAHGIIYCGNHPLKLLGFTLGTIKGIIIIGSHNYNFKKLFTF
jgi:hypothetical protein